MESANNFYFIRGAYLVGDPPLTSKTCLINYKKYLKYKLNNNQSSPNAISHKELNTLLNKAKKEMLSIQTSENGEINKNNEFNDLIKDWTKKSQEILLVLNQKDQTLTRHMNHKSLIAFGAMGAHINMAIQALKETEFDQ